MSEVVDVVHKVCVKLDVLSERFDRHMGDHSDKFGEIFKRLDAIKDSRHNDKEELLKKIQDVEIQGVRLDSTTNAKIAAISGGIAVAVSMLTFLAERMLR